MRVPWTARTSNQSILKEIDPKYSLEGLMLKLDLQYSGAERQLPLEAAICQVRRDLIPGRIRAP